MRSAWPALNECHSTKFRACKPVTHDPSSVKHLTSYTCPLRPPGSWTSTCISFTVSALQRVLASDRKLGLERSFTPDHFRKTGRRVSDQGAGVRARSQQKSSPEPARAYDKLARNAEKIRIKSESATACLAEPQSAWRLAIWMLRATALRHPPTHHSSRLF